MVPDAQCRMIFHSIYLLNLWSCILGKLPLQSYFPTQRIFFSLWNFCLLVPWWWALLKPSPRFEPKGFSFWWNLETRPQFPLKEDKCSFWEADSTFVWYSVKLLVPWCDAEPFYSRVPNFHFPALPDNAASPSPFPCYELFQQTFPLSSSSSFSSL